MKIIDKIQFATSVNTTINITETFSLQDDSFDKVTINGRDYFDKQIPGFGKINILDINFDIDKYSVKEKYYQTIHVCGTFTYKFVDIPEQFADILDTETIHTGYIYYFENHYEDIKELEDYSNLYFCAELNIVEKNDVFDRESNIHYETVLVEID